MTLVRWEPLLSTDFNRLFGTGFRTPGGDSATLRRWIPAMDVHEADDRYTLRLDLPGIAPEAVSIELDDRTLTIAGERSSEREENKDGYKRVERASGSFRRSLTLPEGVDGDAITAGFEHGVLEIRVPKPAQRKPRRIEIGGAEPKTLEANAA